MDIGRFKNVQFKLVLGRETNIDKDKEKEYRRELEDLKRWFQDTCGTILPDRS